MEITKNNIGKFALRQTQINNIFLNVGHFRKGG